MVPELFQQNVPESLYEGVRVHTTYGYLICIKFRTTYLFDVSMQILVQNLFGQI